MTDKHKPVLGAILEHLHEIYFVLVPEEVTEEVKEE
jgi:hypothetical protein